MKIRNLFKSEKEMSIGLQFIGRNGRVFIKYF